MKNIFIVDLDDTLCLTTKCLRGDASRVNELKLAFDADTFLNRYGKQSILVTTGDKVLQEKKLSVLGITNSFKEVHIIDPQKVKMDVFLQIMGNSKGSKCWVMGDRPDVEIRAGSMLGISTIRMRIVGGKYYRLEPRNRMEKPTLTFYSFSELLTFLEKEE
jgi:FMN phosphatase YigB (HAD superfamily)